MGEAKDKPNVPDALTNREPQRSGPALWLIGLSLLCGALGIAILIASGGRGGLSPDERSQIDLLGVVLFCVSGGMLAVVVFSATFKNLDAIEQGSECDSGSARTAETATQDRVNLQSEAIAPEHARPRATPEWWRRGRRWVFSLSAACFLAGFGLYADANEWRMIPQFLGMFSRSVERFAVLLMFSALAMVPVAMFYRNLAVGLVQFWFVLSRAAREHGKDILAEAKRSSENPKVSDSDIDNTRIK